MKSKAFGPQASEVRAHSDEYLSFVGELFAPAFPVRIRRMFGGAGIFWEEVMVGLVAYERIYLKVDDTTKADFEAEGSKPFVFTPKSGERVAMSYLELPERLYDEPDEMRAWALKARDVGMRAKTKPKKQAAKASGRGKRR